MTLPEPVTAALVTAVTALVAAATTWGVGWINRKVKENELANAAIKDATKDNAGRIDAVHDLLNGGQIAAIVEMAVSNSEAVKTLTTVAVTNAESIRRLLDFAKSNRAAIEAVARRFGDLNRRDDADDPEPAETDPTRAPAPAPGE